MYEQKSRIAFNYWWCISRKTRICKKTLPQIQWADGEIDSFEKIQNAIGIYHFEIYIKRILKNEKLDIKRNNRTNFCERYTKSNNL